MKINPARVLVLFALGLLVMAGFMYFRIPDVKVMVPVPFGTTAQDVIDMLSDNGLIASRKAFLTLLKTTDTIGKIKAGMYEFTPRENMFSIWKKLTSGRTVKLRVTIPEGLTIKQIAEILQSKGLFTAEDFENYANENNLEGYLFPETYFFEYYHSPGQVAGIMKRQFERIYSPEFDEKRKKYRFTREDHIILASIIEKETRFKDEKPLVSAVFHNRLKKRIYLESCATVQYALGGWKKRLSYKDLEINSPFNTYINFGLPPAPICSPGLDSLIAAVNPAEVNYLYFVADGLGGNKFYTNYRDHLKGRESLIRFRREYERNKRK